MYIEKLILGEIEPLEGQITLESYLVESLYITKYMSQKIKATNISTYHALFYLSYGKYGIGKATIPWFEVGALCASEQGKPIIKNEILRERTKILKEFGCIEINVNRTGPNNFIVNLPSEIDFVKELIKKENSKIEKEPKLFDYYNDPLRKIMILKRDSYKCAYCLLKVNEETYVIDHIVSRVNGGTNFKNNLVTSCIACNNNKSHYDVFDFLLDQYRNGLLKQKEYLYQKQYIHSIMNDNPHGEIV